MLKLKKHIIPLLIILAFSIFTWNFVYQKIEEPKEYEKIVLFVSGTVIDNNLENDIKISCNVRKVSIQEANIDDQYYGVLLQTSGMLMSDLLIIKKEILEDGNSRYSFVEITDEIIESYDFPIDLTFVEIEDEKYGIVVYDKENNINLLAGKVSFDSDDVYVLVINKGSCNASPYGTDKNITDNAFKAIKELVNERGC